MCQKIINHVVDLSTRGINKKKMIFFWKLKNNSKILTMKIAEKWCFFTQLRWNFEQIHTEQNKKNMKTFLSI